MKLDSRPPYYIILYIYKYEDVNLVAVKFKAEKTIVFKR